jgi:hypothetical protein
MNPSRTPFPAYLAGLECASRPVLPSSRTTVGFGGCLLALGLVCLTSTTQAAAVYAQPHDGSGALYQSSVNGTDYDQLTWDLFRVTNSTAITEIRWRGGYLYGGTYSGAATNWTIAIYRDIANGYQPDIINPPYATYTLSDPAGQTPAGTFGNTVMYDYAFTLPAPFQAAAGSNYWLLIQANQTGIPEWAIARGSGGDGGCFRRTAGAADWWFYRASGDTAFTLLTTDGPTVAIAASASPANGGEVLGAGVYPVGSTVSLTANPAAGFGFLQWTENGTPVVASANYQFTAASARTLVAEFVAAYTITVSASPNYGGSVAGGGTFNQNTAVTVTAMPNLGYTFENWTEFGTPVSTAATYTFDATANRALVANFVSAPATATFDFDTGTPPVGPTQGMPASQTQNGITAYFTALANTWSVQNTFYGWVPAVFSGNFLYPSSLAGGALAVEFSQPATNFSTAFFTGDVSSEYDTPTTLRVTAYTDSAMTHPVTEATGQGQWLTGAYPEGTLSLGSTTPFTTVKIDMPPGQGRVSYLFWVDNLVAQTVPPPPVMISTTVSPANAGTVSGAGTFANGTSVTLVATPNAGYDFVNWTENSAAVSASASYTFAATADRVLVANFVQRPPTFTVVTSALPSNGGTTSGDGAYTNGQPVTVTATPASGYQFVNWAENNAPVSPLASYTFTASTDRFLIANFAALPALTIQLGTNAVVLRWPTNSVTFTLEQNTVLGTTAWTGVTEPVNVVGPNNEVTTTPLAGQQFFRLRYP